MHLDISIISCYQQKNYMAPMIVDKMPIWELNTLQSHDRIVDENKILIKSSTVLPKESRYRFSNKDQLNLFYAECRFPI
jgi:hypothetical protein